MGADDGETGSVFPEGRAVHVIQRGNNREPVFFDGEDYQFYLAWLGEAAAVNDVRIDANSLSAPDFHEVPH